MKAEHFNYDVVRKIIYEQIINFFTNNEEHLHAKYLEWAYTTVYNPDNDLI